MTTTELIDSIYTALDRPLNEIKGFIPNTARQQAESFDAEFTTLKASHAALEVSHAQLKDEKAAVDAELAKLKTQPSELPRFNRVGIPKGF